jgi:hypothetical protein
MITTTGRALSSMTVLTGFILALIFVAPAKALDMQDMVVDSISAHPEVKEKIHVYRQVISDRDIAESGWRPSIDARASTGFYDTESPSTGNQSVDYDSTNLELSVTQNLFNGYDTTYQIEQTRARTNAALFDVYDTADNIALRAIQAERCCARRNSGSNQGTQSLGCWQTFAVTADRGAPGEGPGKSDSPAK